MMALLIIALLIAFLGAIAITLRAIQHNREGLAIGGIFAMIFLALQLGGAAERLLS